MAGDAVGGWRGRCIKGCHLLVEPTGADTYVVVKTAAGLITVRVPPSTPVTVGEQIGLSVSNKHNNWFDAQSGMCIS